MRKYYTHNGNEQLGPFSLAELKSRKITKNTPVWFEGLSDWVDASAIDELKDYFENSPPPFQTNSTTPPKLSTSPPPTENTAYPTSKKNSSWKTIVIVITLIVIGGVGLNFYKNKAGANLKVTVNPPSPRVLNSRTETDPNATLLDYKQAVYATIYNDGGSGRILVTATIDQGRRHFEETKEIFLGENSSQEVYLMFDGPKALGGSIDFNVFAKSIE